MRIAVNAIFLQKNKLEGYGYFVQEIFSRLAMKYPQHEFLFLFDRPYDEEFLFSKNVKPIVITPKARQPISFKYWYDIKLPLALRGLQPDVLVQPYGFCSLTIKVPQLLVVHDLAFQHYPHFIAKQHLFYYQFFTKRFLNKAKHIATVSEFSKGDIIAHYNIEAHKIDVIYSAAKEIFKPMASFIQEQTKNLFAEGKEYFLFVGGVHPRKNLMNLLKAFSIFKRRQRSSMKLLVVGRLAWKYDDVVERLKTYKYRNDVVLLHYLNEADLAAVMASAYALIFPSFFEGFGVPIIEAMQSNVPVITSNTSSLLEIGTDAVLYANPNDPEGIASQMMQLYKDESMRNRLIATGNQQAARFSWDRTAELMWQSILTTVASPK